MGYIVSLVNQKGGVGKTTTSVNLATALALRGRKVLLLDMDPQGNASSALNSNPNHSTIYDVLCGQITFQQAIQKTELNTLEFISSNSHLVASKTELLTGKGWEFYLKKKLCPFKKDYDYIFIDCPPSLDRLTISVLVCSEQCIVPLQCEYYALEGLSQLMDTIDRIQASLNPGLEMKGILLTMFDQRNRLSYQVEAEVRKFFEKKVFQTIVPRNVRLSEAPSFGKSIFQYDPSSLGAKHYFALSSEFDKSSYN